MKTLCTLFALFLSPILFAQTETPMSNINLGYKDGLHFDAGDRFHLTINGYIQGSFVGVINDDRGDEDEFDVPRARLSFSGHVYDSNFRYMIEYDFAETELQDAYAEFGVSKMFNVRVGNQKFPYAFESLVPESQLQFVDLSLVHTVFTEDFGILDARELGLSFLGESENKKISYQLGVYNG